jgi:putative DNA primase/helicase
MQKQELLSHVLQRLSDLTGQQPVQKGDWHNCRCVAHEDANPSLGVKAGDKAIIFKCQAGCAPKDIVARLGLSMRDTFYRDEHAERAERESRAQANSFRPTGITLQQLAAYKSFPIEHLEACGVREIPRAKGGGVQITYRLADGTDAPRHRLRYALKAKDGSRWSGTKESGPIAAYGLWRVREAQDAGRLTLVEGETDCLALWLHQEPALGIPGASAVSALDPATLNGIGTIYIIQEPDKAGSQFPTRIWQHIRDYWRGEIKIIKLEGAKDPCELHQVYGAQFADRWSRALAGAKPFDKGEERYWFIPERGTADDGDHLPQDVCDYLLQSDFSPLASNVHTLAYHRDGFYRHDGKAWVEYPLGELRAAVVRFTRAAAVGKPNGHFVSDTILNLTAQTTIPSTTQAPVWLSTSSSAARVIALENGILDLEALTGATGKTLRSHTSDLWSFNALPYSYQPGADCPKWQSFLDDVLPRESAGEQTLQDLLSEWFGYCLLPTQQYQRVLLMVGEGANGKSVAMSVLRRLVGERNCSDVSLESLALPHATAGLIGKLVNFCDEFGYISGDAEGCLKAISGGGWIQINPKYQAPYTAKIFARFTVASNEPPRINDRSDAMWRRLLIVPFNKQIDADKRKPLEPFVDELCAELPGILNWALCGLIRLLARSRFIDTNATSDAKADYQLSSNPARTWLEDQCAVVAGQELRGDTAYTKYSDWCKANNYRPLALGHWGNELRRWAKRLGLDLPRDLPRRTSPEGVRYRVYPGVDWATDPLHKPKADPNAF